MYLATVVIMEKKHSQKKVLLSHSGSVAEELVFWVSVWCIQSCFPNKFQNSIKFVVQVYYVVAERLKEEVTLL